jgi:hypothetical protein
LDAKRMRVRDHKAEYEKRAAVKRAAQEKQMQEQRAATPPYQLGRQDAASHRAAVETYNARPPPEPIPWAKGTPEEIEYDRGWRDSMRQSKE